MSRTFFAGELDNVATFWRVQRRDGVLLGFTSHDRDLTTGGITYRSAPGMVPSAIRRTADLDRDSVEVRGVLAHDALSAQDLADGRFAGARIAIGVIDWQTGETATLFHGELGSVTQEDGRFEAELRSAKASLEADLVPRTSPTCRAAFCDKACQLSPARFTHAARLSGIETAENRVRFDVAPDGDAMLHGQVRWIDGPHAGLAMTVLEAGADGLVLDIPLAETLSAGVHAILREGCDHTIATCAGRFGNAANFQGEPFLPGNDLLARYPAASR
ncbi:DUF2163 domain-containing protein [Aurantiacibacter spongiae]|uniref:DUF2163 domain-containing protein n=1 Tax=Aurantiacibacter spongiae TaxID=2488860 RepID=A0A3N5CSD5_9SPHN|nr:DUF2163 domain-containing protein [Aurantiacibacter spongiae]RPF71266.1 DUF2163 domain-containing protein [Aurantiacibacter spongiae]